MTLETVPRISRRLPAWAAAEVAALQAAYALRFPPEDISDCVALFADAMTRAAPDSAFMVHRFRLRRAMELAKGCITETAMQGGDLATTAAGALFVLARRGEGDAERYALERGVELFKQVYAPALRELEGQ